MKIAAINFHSMAHDLWKYVMFCVWSKFLIVLNNNKNTRDVTTNAWMFVTQSMDWNDRMLGDERQCETRNRQTSITAINAHKLHMCWSINFPIRTACQKAMEICNENYARVCSLTLCVFFFQRRSTRDDIDASACVPCVMLMLMRCEWSRQTKAWMHTARILSCR